MQTVVDEPRSGAWSLLWTTFILIWIVLTAGVAGGLLGDLPPAGRVLVGVGAVPVALLQWRGIQTFRGVRYQITDQELIATSNGGVRRVPLTSTSAVTPVISVGTGATVVATRPFFGLRVAIRDGRDLFISPSDRQEFRRLLADRVQEAQSR